jgi:hypothetical protein
LLEHGIQAAFFDWARAHPIARRAYAIPNAAKRSPRLAAMMVAEGLRRGVLDVHLPVARGGCNGLWIEFKAGDNGLTADQASEAEQLAKDGFAVVACWGAIIAIEIVSRYLNGEVQPGFTSYRPVKPGRVKSLVKKAACAVSRSAPQSH